MIGDIEMKEDVKYVKIAVTQEEREFIKNKAKKRCLTIQEYAKMKLFDEVEGVDSLRRRISRKVPDFYNHINEIQEPRQREWFLGWGEILCQYLR